MIIDPCLTRGLLQRDQISPSFVDCMLTWYAANKRELPWRLEFFRTGDPYAVWVSEIMLQQTTIQVVIPAYRRFIDEFPNLNLLAAADETAVRLACRGLGYYRRFRMLHEAAKLLSHQANFAWPNDFISWRTLPGVGDYTAAAVSSIAFSVAKAVVDGNVERVFCRLLDLRIAPDNALKKALQKLGDQLIPAAAPGDYNQAIMELGQTICTKKQPRCSVCPVQEFCLAFARSSQTQAPASRTPKLYEDVRLHLVLLHKKGQLALIQRSKDARFLSGTLGLPTAIESETGQLTWEQASAWRLQKKSIGSFKHSITKHRIQAFVHNKQTTSASDPAIIWVPFAKVETQLLSNLDRKAWQLFQKSQPQWD